MAVICSFVVYEYSKIVEYGILYNVFEYFAAPFEQLDLDHLFGANKKRIKLLIDLHNTFCVITVNSILTLPYAIDAESDPTSYNKL